MSTWIVSVCGIAFLTILCDVIVPDGNTKKYVRTVIGIVVSLTMLLPIANFAFGENSINAQDQSQLVVDQQFLAGIEHQQQYARLQNVKRALVNLSLDQCSVDIDEGCNFVKVLVVCDSDTISLVKQALTGVDDQIVIVWRNSSG